VPWPEDDPADWIALRRSDLYWTRTHLLPWIRRHLRGQSMGDGLAPKRPHLTPLLPLPSPPADDRATTR